MALTSSSTKRVDTPWNRPLLDHRRQRLLGGPTGLQEPREVAVLAQLRDLQVDRSGARLPKSVTIRRGFSPARGSSTRSRRCTDPPHPLPSCALGEELNHLAQQVRIGPLLASSLSALLALVIVFLLIKVEGVAAQPKSRTRWPLQGRRPDQRSASPTAPLRADPGNPSYTTSRDATDGCSCRRCWVCSVAGWSPGQPAQAAFEHWHHQSDGVRTTRRRLNEPSGKWREAKVGTISTLTPGRTKLRAAPGWAGGSRTTPCAAAAPRRAARCRSGAACHCPRRPSRACHYCPGVHGSSLQDRPPRPGTR
jgi:hypothetical protein